jgi:arylformamidase
LFPSNFEIIDISQPVNSRTACFPGDVPFSRDVIVNYNESKIINLSTMTTSPHVGTHADAVSHIKGSMEDTAGNIGAAPLQPYIGHCLVVDVSPMSAGAITAESLRPYIGRAMALDLGVQRVLIKTQEKIDYEKWQDDYPYLSVGAVKWLNSLGTVLVGLDTPSMDQVNSKTLSTHNALEERHMYWLENLDLTRVESGPYFLMAAPLKFMELEASPIRAVLLR